MKGAGARRFAEVALAVAWRGIHNYVRTPSLLLPTLVFPLFFFSAFAGGLSRIDQAPGFDYSNGYTAFEFAFVLMQSAAFGGVFTGFGIARDFETGFGRRLMLAAPNRLALIVGYAISALFRAVLVGGFLFAIAVLTGMQVSSNVTQLVGLITLALLINVAAGLWASGVALRFRSIQAGPLMQTPVFLILFLSPVYVPLNLLNSWIHSVASYNPVTPVVEAARDLIAGGYDHVGAAFLTTGGLIILFGIWAVRSMRSAEAAGA